MSKSSIVCATAALVGLAAAGPMRSGWQYGDDLISEGTLDPEVVIVPAGPPQTARNPLQPEAAKAMPLAPTKFEGRFMELDEYPNFYEEQMKLKQQDPDADFDAATGPYQNIAYDNFDFLHVTPTGEQFEFAYDERAATAGMFDYVKSLLQPDDSAVGPDEAGNVQLRSAFDPGFMYYDCAESAADGGAKLCKQKGPATAAPPELAKTEDTSSRGRRYIFGSDDRTPVATASRTNFPYRVVGIVGNHCTGTLVGPRHVLTAGHCVHSGPGGDWIADLSFRPAFDKDAATQAPYGKIPWSKASTTKSWAQSGSWGNDYAIIELAYDTGLGYMSFGWNSGLNIFWSLNLNGYPGPNTGASPLWGKMYHHYGSLSWVSGESFEYRSIDMVKGTSGSGVYRYDSNNGKRVIYGVNNVQVHAWGDSKAASDNFIAGHTWPSHNQAVRITSSKFARICGWINNFAALGC